MGVNFLTLTGCVSITAQQVILENVQEALVKV